VAQNEIQTLMNQGMYSNNHGQKKWQLDEGMMYFLAIIIKKRRHTWFENSTPNDICLKTILEWLSLPIIYFAFKMLAKLIMGIDCLGGVIYT